MTENPDDLFGQEHVQRYLETDGEVGHEWRGAEVLLLTTKGRRSGEDRTTPLIYQPYGGDHLIVASNGGFNAPGWYLNIQESPTVELQIKDDRFTARARTAKPDEKPGMWRTMTDVWPAYDDYQERTDREIPVVVLERE